MVRANPISSASENDGCHNRRDVDDLDEREQGVVSKDAVAKQQHPGNKPDEPRGSADAPGAFFNIEMVYLRHIGNDDERRPGPTQHFHLQSHFDPIENTSHQNYLRTKCVVTKDLFSLLHHPLCVVADLLIIFFFFLIATSMIVLLQS